MEKVPILLNHQNQVNSVVGSITLQKEEIQRIILGLVTIEPGWIEHPDGTKEIMEFSIVSKTN